MLIRYGDSTMKTQTGQRQKEAMYSCMQMSPKKAGTAMLMPDKVASDGQHFYRERGTYKEKDSVDQEHDDPTCLHTQ